MHPSLKDLDDYTIFTPSLRQIVHPNCSPWPLAELKAAYAASKNYGFYQSSLATIAGFVGNCSVCKTSYGPLDIVWRIPCLTAAPVTKSLPVEVIPMPMLLDDCVTKKPQKACDCPLNRVLRIGCQNASHV